MPCGLRQPQKAACNSGTKVDNAEVGGRFPEKTTFCFFLRREYARIADEWGRRPSGRVDMLNRLIWAALMICVPGTVLAGEPDPFADPPSMRFAWVREGPAEACGLTCREWIVASGPITSDTARDFNFFTQARDARGATLVLDSGGGSVSASLDLGRRLRELGIVTTVGRVTLTDSPPGTELRGKLSARGECASMCVFVLLGGVRREVPPESRVLVHEIWPGGKRYDASAESYTAEEIVRIQRDVGRIARYTVEMGGDIGLFELAMRIPPWERLRLLTQGEMRRLKLQNVEVAAIPTSGAVSSSAPAKSVPRRPLQGWTLQGAGRAAVLERRHPLTVEGEEIGHFELTLTCGTAGKDFRIDYAEARDIEDDGAPIPLKVVTLTLNGERVALRLETSAAAKSAPDELNSSANGTVPLEALERLRKDPDGVIIVGTRTADNFSTSIRVGTAGFAKALAQFPAYCAAPTVSAQATR
jgi:hypothetical protein